MLTIVRKFLLGASLVAIAGPAFAAGTPVAGYIAEATGSTRTAGTQTPGSVTLGGAQRVLVCDAGTPPVCADPNAPAQATLTALYPFGAVAVSGASGIVAGAGAPSASLPAVSGKTNYVSGIDCGGGGSTTGSLVTVTLAGVLSGSVTYTLGVVTGATAADVAVIRTFNPPLQASGTNVAMTVSAPTYGTGNVNAYCNIYGYYE